MAKICATLALICFTIFVLPSPSKGRYLLVELDGAPDESQIDEGGEIPEPEVPEEETEMPDEDVLETGTEPPKTQGAQGVRALGDKNCFLRLN